MSEMVERVARAIGDGASVCGAPWNSFSEVDQLKLRNAARAALNATRKPTAIVVEQVARAIFATDQDDKDRAPLHEDCYVRARAGIEAFIDAALKED